LNILIRITTTFGLVLIFTCSQAVLAESVRFCFEINAEYEDAGQQYKLPGSSTFSGVTEDNWNYRLATNPYPAPPSVNPSSADANRYEPFRGGLIEVYKGRNTRGEKVFSGFLDDGSGRAVGCMPRRQVSTANGTYYFRVWARHRVRGWEIRGVDNSYATKYQDFQRNVAGATGQNTIRMLFFVGAYPTHTDEARVRRRYVAQAANAAAFALARERLGIESGNLLVRIASGPGQARSNCSDARPPSKYNGWDCILLYQDSNAGSKTYIAHELGHVLWRKKTPNGYIDYDARSSSPDCTGGNGHRLYSIEYVGAATYEGFAHAYSVRIWNKMNDSTDATYSYSLMRVDFDNPSGRFHSRPFEAAIPFMETQCPGQTNFSGLGNEMDWGRTFWQTASCMAASSSYSESNAYDAMTDVVARSIGWNRSNVWQLLDRTFDAYPSNSAIRRCWNSASQRNGVDH
jgi:hypothetical protein